MKVIRRYVNMGRCRNAGFAGVKAYHVLQDQWGFPFYVWLVYRWLAAFYLSVWLVLSVWEFSGSKEKYLLNITSWSFILLTLITLIKACLVTSFTHNKSTERRTPLHHKSDGHLSCCLKITWCGDTIASVTALGVTVGFWAVLNRDGSMPVTAVTIHTHGINGVYALLDLLLSAKRVRLLHFWHPMVFACLYVLFSYTYWIAGGTGTNNAPYIYRSLDWRQPNKTLPVALGFCIVLPLILHLFLYVVFRARKRIYHRTHKNNNADNHLMDIRGNNFI